MPKKAAGPGTIPLNVSAKRAITQREQYSGRVLLKQLPRLVPLLAETAGELTVALEAGKDGEGGRLTGSIRGELCLTCQRGLHPFGWQCEVPVDLRLVDSEAEEEEVLQDQDPYLVQDDLLPLRDIVEDEVLLALPMMPRCDDPNCLKNLK